MCGFGTPYICRLFLSALLTGSEDDLILFSHTKAFLQQLCTYPVCVCSCVLLLGYIQEWSQRIYGKARPENDPTKFDEFQEAYETLDQALKIFAHLERLGKAVTRIEPRKLKAHVSYCKESLAKVG